MALALLSARAARAGDNDLELWRLGNVDPITICTKCDGTDSTLVPGDKNAQVRFARLTATLGLAFIPAFNESENSLGQSGFELGFVGQVAFPNLAAQDWATSGTHATQSPPTALFLPTLRLRKGLGGSLELGTAITYLSGSQILALTGEVRFSPVDGLAYAPDVAVRIYGTRVVGAESLDLTVGGIDLGVSKGFGVVGMVRLQPYGEAGMAFINAASGVIDFNPGSVNVRDPTAQDGTFHTLRFFHNGYLRGALGLRVIAGAVVLGLEGGIASGTNPSQTDSPAGYGPVPTATATLWHASAHLGFAY